MLFIAVGLKVFTARLWNSLLLQHLHWAGGGGLLADWDPTEGFQIVVTFHSGRIEILMIFSGCWASFNWVSILLQNSLRSVITLLGKRLCLEVSHLGNFIDSWEPTAFHLLSRAGVGWGNLFDLLSVGLGDLLFVGFDVSPAQRSWLLLEDGFGCCHELLVWTSLLIWVVIWNDDDLIELNRRLYTLTGGRGRCHRVLLVEPVGSRAQISGWAPQANRIDLRRRLAACPASFPLGYSSVDE